MHKHSTQTTHVTCIQTDITQNYATHKFNIHTKQVPRESVKRKTNVNNSKTCGLLLRNGIIAVIQYDCTQVRDYTCRKGSFAYDAIMFPASWCRFIDFLYKLISNL